MVALFGQVLKLRRDERKGRTRGSEPVRGSRSDRASDGEEGLFKRVLWGQPRRRRRGPRSSWASSGYRSAKGSGHMLSRLARHVPLDPALPRVLNIASTVFQEQVGLRSRSDVDQEPRGPRASTESESVSKLDEHATAQAGRSKAGKAGTGDRRVADDTGQEGCRRRYRHPPGERHLGVRLRE